MLCNTNPAVGMYSQCQSQAGVCGTEREKYVGQMVRRMVVHQRERGRVRAKRRGTTPHIKGGNL